MHAVETPPGSGTWTWTCPTVAFCPEELTLMDIEDVDAFAFDEAQGYILLSTDHRVAGTPRQAT